jgi:hypothetical protein
LRPSKLSEQGLHELTPILLCLLQLQVFDLSDGELEWLSNHLGHNLEVHKDTYRLHGHAVEISKVSRIQLAIESGDVATSVERQVSE